MQPTWWSRPPTTGPFRRLPFFIKQVIDTFAQKNASRMAGAIAYFGIFSFAPLLIVAVLVAGSVLQSSDAHEVIVDRLGDFVSQWWPTPWASCSKQ